MIVPGLDDMSLHHGLKLWYIQVIMEIMCLDGITEIYHTLPYLVCVMLMGLRNYKYPIIQYTYLLVLGLKFY